MTFQPLLGSTLTSRSTRTSFTFYMFSMCPQVHRQTSRHSSFRPSSGPKENTIRSTEEEDRNLVEGRRITPFRSGVRLRHYPPQQSHGWDGEIVAPHPKVIISRRPQESQSNQAGCYKLALTFLEPKSSQVDRSRTHLFLCPYEVTITKSSHVLRERTNPYH